MCLHLEEVQMCQNGFCGLNRKVEMKWRIIEILNGQFSVTISTVEAIASLRGKNKTEKLLYDFEDFLILLHGAMYHDQNNYIHQSIVSTD